MFEEFKWYSYNIAAQKLLVYLFTHEILIWFVGDIGNKVVFWFPPNQSSEIRCALGDFSGAKLYCKMLNSQGIG